MMLQELCKFSKKNDTGRIVGSPEYNLWQLRGERPEKGKGDHRRVRSSTKKTVIEKRRRGSQLGGL